jgi:Kelch motif
LIARIVPRALIVALVALAVGAGVVLAATNIDNGSSERAPARGTATDRWIELAPSDLARTEVAAARIDNFIYVVGGFLQAGSGGVTTNAVERYDIAKNRWSRVRSMPIAVNHPAGVAYKGDLYVVGGYRGRGDLKDEVGALQRYEPKRDRWTRLRSMPTRRAALAAGVLGDRLYAAGGANSTEGALKRLEIYDFRKDRWSRGPDFRTRAREHLAGVSAGGYFYALAGREGGKGNFTVAERFDPRSGRWQLLPNLKKSRGGIAAAATGDRVVVFGGEEPAGTIKEVELYDPAKRRWKRLPNLPTPRHGLGGAAFGSRVYAIEGGTSPGFSFSRAIEALDVR